MKHDIVPVIDISAYRSGSETGKQVIAAEIDRACRLTGFLVVSGHGVPVDLIQRMDRVTRAFFDLPLEQKQKCSPGPDGYRGYQALEANALAKTLDVADAPPDLFERFTVGALPGDPSDPYYTADMGKIAFAPNIWPDSAEFAAVWQEYYRAMEGLAKTLMRLFALGLKLPETWFDDKIAKHMSAMVANHYPEQQTEPLPGQLRAGAHTDYGSLTILKTEAMPGGLEVMAPDGGWSAVPVIAGTFIINIGDLMAQWTNDLWVSTMHRVVNPPRDQAGGNRRQSLVFFHQPNYDALIECLPAPAVKGPPKYAPVTSGEHLHLKVAKQLEKTAQKVA